MEAFVAVLSLAAKAGAGAKEEDALKLQMDDAKVPMKILDAIERHISVETEPSKTTLVSWANAVKDLLQEYAMTEYHRNQIINIKRVITSKDANLGNSIDMSLFSRCTFWAGKIAFSRY
jgi:hypothetical protein